MLEFVKLDQAKGIDRYRQGQVPPGRAYHRNMGAIAPHKSILPHQTFGKLKNDNTVFVL